MRGGVARAEGQVALGGEVLAEGGEGACYVSADIDPERVRVVRQEFSALNDRVLLQSNEGYSHGSNL